MARSERQEAGPRAGVGTMTRQGTRTRAPQAPEGGPAAADPRRGRQPRPVPPPRPPAPAGAADPRVPPQGAPAGRRGAQATAAAPARPGARLRAAAPWQVAPAGRVTGPQPARTTGPQPAAVKPAAVKPATGQPVRTTGPQPAAPGAVAPKPQPARAALGGSRRMPFVLLLCGLLGGALVSALVISTTLAEGSFKINKLQGSTSSLARQRQTLLEQVAQGQSAQVIEQRAAKLGMRRPNELQFIDLKTGKVTNDGPTWSGAVNAPGYAP